MSMQYGPEANGLLCGFHFGPEGAGRAIGLDEALAILARGDAAEGFLWLHFSLADAAAVPWLRAHLALPEAFYDALQEGSRSTRIEDAQDQLLAVVNDVAYEFAFDASQIESLWAGVSAKVAVTARVHALRSVDRLRQAVLSGARFPTSMRLLDHLLNDQGDVLVRIVREATVRVDAVEDRLLRGYTSQQREDLGQLRRVLVRLQRLLAPEPAALFRLLRQPPPWVHEDDLDQLRQSTEEFSLVLRDMASLQERIKLVQEEMAARREEMTNRSLFTLTMVTVLALPINITAGLFGMNVGGIPWAEARHGFALVVLLVTAVTGIAAWIAFRRRD